MSEADTSEKKDASEILRCIYCDVKVAFTKREINGSLSSKLMHDNLYFPDGVFYEFFVAKKKTSSWMS